MLLCLAKFATLLSPAGLIEGYTTERETLEQKMADLEEQKETLVLSLETTKNRLHDLESMKSENEKLRREMQEQQQLLTSNVGDEAQGLRRFRFLVVPLSVVVGCYLLQRFFNGTE